MKSILLTLSLLATFAGSAQKKHNMQKTIVLVHGAFAGDYAWNKLTPLLEASGNKVITVNLPGHGTDNTPPQQATFDNYVAAVSSAVNRADGNVILVGHSMAGMVISQVAENSPNKIEKLVYLSAYLPKDGQDLQTLASTDGESLIGANLKFAADYSTASLPADVAQQVFAVDGGDDAKILVAGNAKPEPLSAFQAKVHLTEKNWGAVPIIYIETTKDQGVGNKLQKKMVADNGRVQKVYTIESSHSPYWAKPKELADILNNL